MHLYVAQLLTKRQARVVLSVVQRAAALLKEQTLSLMDAYTFSYFFMQYCKDAMICATCNACVIIAVAKK